MKALLIKLPLWKWSGELVCGGEGEDFKAYVIRMIGKEPQVGKHSCGHAVLHEGLPWFIWIRAFPDPPTLAHEALHITCGVLEVRGVTHSTASEEAYTYTLESIVRAAAAKKGWKRLRQGRDF
jgi:hypothetical protein